MRNLVCALVLGLLGSVAAGSIGHAMPPVPLPSGDPVISVDWQGPQSLPRRFRNHCATDVFSGRRYCSDHCGAEYQFYFCSHESFGCCRVGFGYCDWSGLLRCHP